MVLTHENLLKTDDRCNAQLAKMSTDPKCIELTADVFQEKILTTAAVSSTNLGSTFIFASCIIRWSLVFTNVLSFKYVRGSYACNQGEHERQNVTDNNGRYCTNLIPNPKIVNCNDSFIRNT